MVASGLMTKASIKVSCACHQGHAQRAPLKTWKHQSTYKKDGEELSNATPCQRAPIIVFALVVGLGAYHECSKAVAKTAGTALGHATAACARPGRLLSATLSGNMGLATGWREGTHPDLLEFTVRS